MNTFKIILKNGHEIITKAKDFEVSYNRLSGNVIEYNFLSIDKNCSYPLFINVNEIAAIIKVGE